MLTGTTWPHGAVGTIIIEPVGSTWHDPKTGKPIRTGPIADIHSVEKVGHDVGGSFREYMLHIQDTVPHTVNVVTAGNPPGQPVEVALEAGKTVAFIMPPIPASGGSGRFLNFLEKELQPFVNRHFSQAQTSAGWVHLSRICAPPRILLSARAQRHAACVGAR